MSKGEEKIKKTEAELIMEDFKRKEYKKKLIREQLKEGELKKDFSSIEEKKKKYNKYIKYVKKEVQDIYLNYDIRWDNNNSKINSKESDKQLYEAIETNVKEAVLNAKKAVQEEKFDKADIFIKELNKELGNVRKVFELDILNEVEENLKKLKTDPVGIKKQTKSYKEMITAISSTAEKLKKTVNIYDLENDNFKKFNKINKKINTLIEDANKHAIGHRFNKADVSIKKLIENIDELGKIEPSITIKEPVTLNKKKGLAALASSAKKSIQQAYHKIKGTDSKKKAQKPRAEGYSKG